MYSVLKEYRLMLTPFISFKYTVLNKQLETKLKINTPQNLINTQALIQLQCKKPEEGPLNGKIIGY